MSEPVSATDPTQPVGDEQSAQEWADEQAERIGRAWLANHPGGKDWRGPVERRYLDRLLG